MSFKDFAQKNLPKVHSRIPPIDAFKVGDFVCHTYGPEKLYAIITNITKRDDQIRIHGRFHSNKKEALEDTSGWIRNGNAKYCKLIKL